MNALWRAIDRSLRDSAAANGLLLRFGINPVHYWVLIDLFGKLSERRELFSHLGRDSMSLRKSAYLFAFMSGIMTMLFVVMGVALPVYFAIFMAISAFLLFTTLLSETNNSLVNPVEGLVLAHQPIDGATYTAAKLTHLLRILAHLVPGFNLIPAVAGLLLAQCPWYYPLLHMGAAFAVGVVLALLCCALFGWLIRIVAPARLKAVGFAAEMSSWLFYVCSQFVGRLHVTLRLPHWLPAGAGPRWAIAGVAFAISAAIVVLGLRALSGDYLVRVAAIAHGGSGGRSKVRRSRLSGLVARLSGGPSARAGFEYVSRMMLRDWQFRRQMLGLIPLLVMLAIGARDGVQISPFSGKFTMAHIIPHAFGLAFFFICGAMVYGTDHQGAWLFLLAPAGAFRGFARGVYARLLILVAIAHLALLALLVWFWGIRDAGIFVAFSGAVSAVYLGLELRLIEGMPFSRQPEGTGNTEMLPIMMMGGMAVTLAVVLQYFLIFHSATIVIVVTLALAVTAWLVTRSSLEAFEVAIRFRLGMLSNESKGLYQEVVG